MFARHAGIGSVAPWSSRSTVRVSTVVLGLLDGLVRENEVIGKGVCVRGLGIPSLTGFPTAGRRLFAHVVVSNHRFSAVAN